MRWPLIVLSLLLLVLFFLRQMPEFFPRHRGWRHLGENMEIAFTDFLWTYALFAPVALLMISDFGKPGLSAQYAGWGIVLLQTLRTVTVLLQSLRSVTVLLQSLRSVTGAAVFPGVKRLLGLFLWASLAYLWILQMPLFDPLPA